MRLAKRSDIKWVFVFVTVLLLACLMNGFTILRAYVGWLQAVGECMESFVSSEGRFPVNADELLEHCSGINAPTLDRFAVAYGAKLEDLEISQGRLIGKDNHRRVRLIGGAGHSFQDFLLSGEYEKMSLHLYNLLRSTRGKTNPPESR